MIALPIGLGIGAVFCVGILWLHYRPERRAADRYARWRAGRTVRRIAPTEF